MTATPRPWRRNKFNGKFSPAGMLVTLLGGIAAGILVGLGFYGLGMVLPFSIPLVFPAIAGGLAGAATLRLGSGIGQCRSPMLAILVALVAGVVTWGTEHVTDYVVFWTQASTGLLQEYPQAPAEAINLAIDAWLVEQTGQGGFVGFMLLKASTNAVSFTHLMGSGAAVSTSPLSGWGLIVYWFVELLIIAGVAIAINSKYATEPYCDNCHTWRKYKTPIIGSDLNLAEAIEYLQQRNITAALRALGNDDSAGNIVRLEAEFCPKCYDSPVAKLVLIQDTGPKTWLEKTVWADKLEPRHIRQILEPTPPASQ